jgi:hypothetical protein
MAIGSPQWMYASGEDAFTIDQSLRFNDDDSAYLTKTFSSGNRQKFTISCWVKRGNLGANIGIFDSYSNNSNFFTFGISSSDQLVLYDIFSGTDYGYKYSIKLRDCSAWYHILLSVDTTQATATDRFRIYVNNEELTDKVSDYGDPPSDYNTSVFNTSYSHRIGYRQDTAGYWDGYMAEYNFIDGTALTPASFGETGDYGEWKPIEYSGSYGTNGFYLDFADSSALGDDESGNTNDWTVNNLTASDQVPDSPTNNFATMNPLQLDPDPPTFAEGNLKVTTPVSGKGNCVSTMGATSGKWYAEVYYVSYSSLLRSCVGITGDSGGSIAANTNIGSLSSSLDVGYFAPDGDKYVGGSETSYGATWAADDIIGIALNIDDDEVTFYKNNASQGAISFASGGIYQFMLGDVSSGGGGVLVANFGQDSSFAGNATAQGNQDSNGIGDFYYEPPNGFLALCSKSLPDVDVVPSEHFNTVLWTGNDTARTISGVGFQPDFNWIRNREITTNHLLFDAVRGASKSLRSDSTSAEGSASDEQTGYTSDGFTLGTGEDVNGNAEGIVSWNWKANGTGSSNTNGSITSTVSANVDAGFSIVSYTGNETAGATIGHGLSKAPEMIIVKNRTLDGEDWRVYHSGIASDAETDFMNLNTTAAAADNAAMWNDTAPSATLITLGGDAATNGDEATIAYAFHSVDGYSKVGSYTGNGDADGTFVYTGFRPEYILLKSSDLAEQWNIFDTARSTTNVVDNYLAANDSSDETSTSNADFDILSNGFKLRCTHDNSNGDGHTYIYLAFAETPFKYSNAR